MNSRPEADPHAELHRRANNAHCTVTDQSRTVSLTVGQVGELKDLQIHPSAYQKLTPRELQDTIMRLYGTAADELLGKLSREFEKVYGFSWTLKDVVDGTLSSRELVEKMTTHSNPSADRAS
ncbi:MAG: YbaB/EbfC family nucleoid-associated protein [Stackebrandtia sp.]